MSRKKIALVVVGGLFVVGAALGGQSTNAGSADPLPSAALPSAPASASSSASPVPSPSADVAVEPSASAPATPTTLEGTVTEVVDGDTIRVELPTGIDTVRIIGIDTPEVVHPSKPEACFGKEASAFAHRVLDGQTVRLEVDPTQDQRDRYDRMLAHVFVADSLYAQEAIAGGFGIHYIYERPTVHADELAAAQATAEQAKAGIWATCQGRVDLPVTSMQAASPKPTAKAPAATAKPKSATSGCHPSYDPCVPNAGHDLDCADIGFQVTVKGPDVYRLDGNHDGAGCESY